MSSSVTLQFVYKNAGNEIKSVSLTGWHESGFYIRGRCLEDGRWKTYRIDRVVEYLEGGASLLTHPFQGPPPRLTEKSHVSLPRSGALEICFTGFAAGPREAMEKRAAAAGLKVVKSVTKSLCFLVGGPNAGPKKVEDARGQQVYILSESQFDALVCTGELPDEQDQRFGTSSQTVKVEDPVRYFSTWHFEIGRHHWATFGMCLRDYTRKDDDGEAETYQAWGVDPLLGFNFQVGDMFYPKGKTREEFVQVAFNTEDGELEVHHGKFQMRGMRRGYVASYEQLAFWLETGVRPKTLTPVFRGNSRAGLLAWELPEGDLGNLDFE